ncbi:MAG: hypothetical protein ACJ74Z_17120 [Bryobacteraceae bacterium]
MLSTTWASFKFPLPHRDVWQDAANKQLAHITYTPDVNPREITGEATDDMYGELKRAWKEFRRCLPIPLAAKFEQEIADNLRTEFQGLDLW